MRIWTAVLLALAMTVSSLGLPTVSPQGTGAGSSATERTTHLAEDKTADVMVNENGVSQPAPGGRWGATDLLALDVKETNEAFAFIVKVQTLAPEGAELPGLESAVYSIYFKNLDRQFKLDVFRQTGAGVSYRAQLQALDPARHAYFTITRDALDITVTEDVAAGTFTATVQRRDLLADSHGAAPHPEVPITGFRVTARALQSDIGINRGPAGGNKVPTPSATDFMPDTGNATANLPVFFGVTQTGHARLRADIPSRASNGEATTFVFDLHATNLDAAEDRFNLVATGVHATWEVKLPADQVTIPGNGTLRLLVLVTTPFAHTHGAYVSFVLEMRSVSDPGSVGRAQLGVRYVNPPQPAGHHPQLWIHSLPAEDDPMSTVFNALFPGGGGDPEAFMNAQESDPNDSDVSVPAELECIEVAVNDCRNTIPSPTPGQARVHYAWEIPLAPTLDMGLDFDMANKGTALAAPPALSVFLDTKLPITAGTFGGRLYYIAPADAAQQQDGFGSSFGNATAVAAVETLTLPDIAPNSARVPVTALITPLPAGDFLPFRQGASLVLRLELNFTRVDSFVGPSDAPMLASGGTLTLPLFEYHDPVCENCIFSSIELVATSKTDRFVNPGDVVLFNITLVNHGDAGDDVKVEMTGTHAAHTPDPWARFVGIPETVHLDPGGSASFVLAVEVPGSATRPDLADIVVTATSASDFNQRALLHLYAIVTPTAEVNYPDERAALALLERNQGEAATPGVHLVALLASLGAVALAMRRRRA